jgi:hypothetical protein
MLVFWFIYIWVNFSGLTETAVTETRAGQTTTTHHDAWGRPRRELITCCVSVPQTRLVQGVLARKLPPVIRPQAFRSLRAPG